jgi:hypothetical protein
MQRKIYLGILLVSILGVGIGIYKLMRPSLIRGYWRAMDSFYISGVEMTSSEKILEVFKERVLNRTFTKWMNDTLLWNGTVFCRRDPSLKDIQKIKLGGSEAYKIAGCYINIYLAELNARRNISIAVSKRGAFYFIVYID